MPGRANQGPAFSPQTPQPPNQELWTARGHRPHGPCLRKGQVPGARGEKSEREAGQEAHLCSFRVDEMLARSCNPSISTEGLVESLPWLPLLLLEPRSLRPVWARLGGPRPPRRASQPDCAFPPPPLSGCSRSGSKIAGPSGERRRTPRRARAGRLTTRTRPRAAGSPWTRRRLLARN